MTAPPKHKFHLSNVPVVAEWEDRNGGARYLGHGSTLTLDVRLDVSSQTATFKLCSIASLKSSEKRVPLYLFIQPDRITSLVEDDGLVQQPVKDGLIQTRKCATPADILRLRFSLTRGALLSHGPPGAGSPPQPKTSPSARILDALRSLCQATALILSLPRNNVPPAFVDALCANAKDGRLKLVPGEVESLYSGQGGRPLEWVDDGDTDPLGRGESPPSYDELGPPPPPPSSRKRLRSARSSPQRDEPSRKKAEKSTTGPSSALVETTARSQPVEDRGRGWNKGVGERIAVLADQLEALKRAVGAANAEPPAPSEDVSTRLAKLEDETASLRAEVAVANSRLLEIAEQLSDETLANLRYEIMEDVETRLAETKDDVIEETEDKIEERFLTVKEDLREAVEEEVENAEERIKEQLSSGMTAVYFEFPR